MKKVRQHPQVSATDIPVYISPNNTTGEPSQDLEKAYALLNSSIHVFTTDLPEDEKKAYIDVLKNWLLAVDT